MTSDSSRLSLMRPVSCGGEPRSSISVTRRRSNPQSDFWTGGRKKDLSRLRSLVEGVNQQVPHLYHDVLQLVVWIRHVGRRQDQQSPLFIELIQESAERLHVCFNLQRCKHTESWSTHFLGVELVSCSALSPLTFTAGRLSVPVAAEQADAAGYSPKLVAPITAVLACCTVVVSIRGAGEETVQRSKQSRASSHWTEKQRRDAGTILRLVWTFASPNAFIQIVIYSNFLAWILEIWNKIRT